MKEETKVYRPPFVEIGMSVLWYPDGDSRQQPHPAFITAVGQDTVCVNIMAPNSYNFMIRDGARHISDPRIKEAERREAGAWDYTPFTRRMLHLLMELMPKSELKKEPTKEPTGG
jgi:hypothetical protein